MTPGAVLDRNYLALNKSPRIRRDDPDAPAPGYPAGYARVGTAIDTAIDRDGFTEGARIETLHEGAGVRDPIAVRIKPPR